MALMRLLDAVWRLFACVPTVSQRPADSKSDFLPIRLLERESPTVCKFLTGVWSPSASVRKRSEEPSTVVVPELMVSTADEAALMSEAAWPENLLTDVSRAERPDCTALMTLVTAAKSRRTLVGGSTATDSAMTPTAKVARGRMVMYFMMVDCKEQITRFGERLTFGL